MNEWVLLGEAAEEVDAPANRRNLQRRFLRDFGGGRHDDHVGPAPAAGGAHNGVQILVDRVHHKVGAQFQRLRAAGRAGLADDHARGAAHRRQLHVQNADWPRAHNHHHIAAVHVDRVLATQHAGQRLNQRRHRGVHRFIHGHEVALLEGECGHAHVLRKRAVEIDADGLKVGVHVVVARNGGAAAAVPHVGSHKNALPQRKALHPLTHGGDRACDLVAGNAHRAGRVVAMAAVVDAQVRAADVGRQHLDKHLVGANRGQGRLLDAQVFGAIPARREHTLWKC